MLTIEQRNKFKAEINSLHSKFKESEITTEESTKMALIVPLFRALGYHVFDPREFSPEFNADISYGIKNGEKVDYAILKDSVPYILIECKHHKERNLNRHVSQLFRYFSVVTSAKLGILTNGIEYRFYSDTEQLNVMDREPFYTFKIDKITEFDISILDLFTKENYSTNSITKTISIIKKSIENKTLFEKKFDEFFEKQEQYVNIDYANLLFNMLFNSDIPKAEIDSVVDIIKSSIIRAKNINQNGREQQIVSRNNTPAINAVHLSTLRKSDGTIEVRLIDVVLNRKELTFCKLVELKNTRTGVTWSISSWAVFIETILNDMIDNGFTANNLLAFDYSSDETQGWIRRVFNGATTSTQKFIKLRNGLWLNTYGNASSMIQRLYKGCSEYTDWMSCYNITIDKLRK